MIVPGEASESEDEDLTLRARGHTKIDLEVAEEATEQTGSTEVRPEVRMRQSQRGKCRQEMVNFSKLNFFAKWSLMLSKFFFIFFRILLVNL